jgi:hypothetical protein
MNGLLAWLLFSAPTFLVSIPVNNGEREQKRKR